MRRGQCFPAYINSKLAYSLRRLEVVNLRPQIQGGFIELCQEETKAVVTKTEIAKVNSQVETAVADAAAVETAAAEAATDQRPHVKAVSLTAKNT
jgi:hypothetical protein